MAVGHGYPGYMTGLLLWSFRNLAYLEILHRARDRGREPSRETLLIHSAAVMYSDAE